MSRISSGLQKDATGCQHGDWLKYLPAGWQLAKVPLCTLIGCSAGFAVVLAPASSAQETVQLAAGVMAAAMGGATLNSLQERVSDGELARTASRPLVQKVVSQRFALLQTCFLIMAGLLLLMNSRSAPLAASLLTVLALVLYNGVYTRLKRKTVLAILPGAVCGGLPPVIGWIGGGGALLSYSCLLLFMLLFLWQVPHFCLILLMHKEDYLHASQPSFLRSLSEKGVRRLSGVWIGALALVMMLFCFQEAAAPGWYSFVLIANAILFALLLSGQLLCTTFISYRAMFILLNIMLGNHMLILACRAIFP